MSTRPVNARPVNAGRSRPPTALTIAGSDSGGGAGIIADLKTFEAHGVWGLAALTAVTAQNTVGVQAFERVDPGLVRAQIESVVTDIGVDAAKSGMLADAGLVRAVAQAVDDLGIAPLVIDPVMVSKHGDSLLSEDASAALRDRLLPLAALVTPNLPEAAVITGVPAVRSRDEMATAGARILALGAGAVLVKGGHLDGGVAADCLVSPDGTEWFEVDRLGTRHTHGTGCVLSAAIAARLALGQSLRDAVAGGKSFVTGAIEAGVELGAGVGPVNPGAGRGRS